MFGVFQTKVKFKELLELNRVTMEEIVYYRDVYVGIEDVDEDTEVVIQYDNGDVKVFIELTDAVIIDGKASNWVLPRYNWELVI